MLPLKLSRRTTLTALLAIALLPAYVCALDKPNPPAGGQEADWGKEQNGLRTRLVLVDGAKVGEPVHVRLEMQNVAQEVRTYDSQQAKVNNSLEVKGPDDKPVPYLDLSYQTAGQPQKLQPGQTVVIFDKLDVAHQYLLDRPGKYAVRFRGRGRGDLPASNVLAITLEAGTLPILTQVYSKVRAVAPADWQLSRTGNAVIASRSMTNLKRDVLHVQLWFTKEKASGYPDPTKGPPNMEYAGETKLGHAWLSASDGTKTQWPKHNDAIREVLKEFTGK